MERQVQWANLCTGLGCSCQLGRSVGIRSETDFGRTNGRTVGGWQSLIIIIITAYKQRTTDRQRDESQKSGNYKGPGEED